MSTSPAYWLVWSNEHSAFWRPNSCGYTTVREAAGRYTKEEAEEICANARHGWPKDKPPEVMVEDNVGTPPMMIASLATLDSFNRPPDREEIAANYRLTKRMAELARREPFILMADKTLLLVSVYVPPTQPVPTP